MAEWLATLPPAVTLRTDFAHNVGSIHANPNQIETVVLNLASNAADALAPEGGEIRVAVERITVGGRLTEELNGVERGTYARLTVSDDGCGMDEATAGRALDPFFTTKEVGEGKGLGLSVVYEIVTQHNGETRLTSAPGKGTVVQAYFPLIEEDWPGTVDAHAESHSSEANVSSQI